VEIHQGGSTRKQHQNQPAILATAWLTQSRLTGNIFWLPPSRSATARQANRKLETNGLCKSLQLNPECFARPSKIGLHPQKK
jgi:hypothetical protein